MRIITYDIQEQKPCGIGVLLRRRAESQQRGETAAWRMLLQLAAHLESADDDHELLGHVIFQELLLYQPTPPDPDRDKQITRLIDEWRARNPDSDSWDDQMFRDIEQRFPTNLGVLVAVRIDWQDRAPLRDGQPDRHYRFRIEKPGMSLTEDARVPDVIEAERVIRKAFGW